MVYCSQNLSPRTVLTVRAALALPLKEAFGLDFEHNHFKMLAKGAFRMKPPVPKIVPSWSLDDALLRSARLGSLGLIKQPGSGRLYSFWLLLLLTEPVS